MICSDYESQLIDRLAARAVIAAKLGPREKLALCRYVRYGDTLREVGEHIGGVAHGHVRVSPERVRQIIVRAERKIAGRGVGQIHSRPWPSEERAAFMQHMQELADAKIERRKQLEIETHEAEQRAIERERRALARLIESEKPAPSPKPVWHPPLLASEVPPGPYVPFQPTSPAVTYSPTFFLDDDHPKPKHQTVEPWFDPRVTPTPEHMQEIARYAVNWFTAMRRPGEPGLQRGGRDAMQVSCRRDADAIAAALGDLSRSIPPSARLSAKPLAGAQHTLGATGATQHVGLLVLSENKGQDVSITVTWDARGLDGVSAD